MLFILPSREEQSLFSPLTVKRREAGVNGCFQELEHHICVVGVPACFAVIMKKPSVYKIALTLLCNVWL